MKIRVKEGRERSFYYKHPWVFSGALAGNDLSVLENGEIIDLVTKDGKFLAKGYYNGLSNIAVRILSFNEKDTVNKDFIKDKINKAYQRRLPFIGNDTAMRVVFAESDGLPGLILDKYDNVFVYQIHTLGMDKMRDWVIESIKELFNPKCIYERSDVIARKQDGVKEQRCGVVYGDEDLTEVEIIESGLKFIVDFANGQKTGFFMDQRKNRCVVEQYAKGKNVLNLFSYTGGFSLYAAKGGAKSVISVDISESACKIAERNSEINGLSSTISVVCADVFKYLEEARDSGKKFDMIVVDPPAFVKSKNKIDNALKAYVSLNESALHLLADDGIIVSSSCSGYISEQDFEGALFHAGLKAGRELSIIEKRGQPFDHPQTLNFPEGRYLKFYVLH